jgi:chromosome segregation ATPase
VVKLEKELTNMQTSMVQNYRQELEQKKEKLRDAEEQCKKAESGSGDSGVDFIKGMLKDCDNQSLALKDTVNQLKIEMAQKQRLGRANQEELHRIKKEVASYKGDLQQIENENKYIEEKLKTFGNASN